MVTHLCGYSKAVVIPLRSCIACRKAANWNELLRIVAIEGLVIPDPNRNLEGRGAWLHRECLEMAKVRNSFKRAFRLDQQGEDLSIAELEKYLKE